MPKWGFAALTWALVACQAAPSPGASCTRSSECGASLVCSYGRCRAECASTRDCPVATRCIASGGIGVCTLDVENHCDTNVCPSPLRCVSDQCRTQCTGGDECVAGACLAGTCVEPVSGVDAGTLDDAGSGPDAASNDAGSQDDAAPTGDAGPSGCAATPAATLRAMLGVTSAGQGLRASTTFVTAPSAARPAVLGLAALARGGVVTTWVATTSDGTPQIWTAPLDAGSAFTSDALYGSVTDAWSIDLSRDGHDLIAMLMRQATSTSDPFGYGHDDSIEAGAADVSGLIPGGAALPPSSTFHGATAIVGGTSPFGGATVPVFHVFHTHDSGVPRVGGVDRGRGVGSYRAVATVPADYDSDVLEMVASHGPLVAMRDPSSGVVGYWRPGTLPAADIVELARGTTTLPGLAASLDGIHSVLAWANGTGVDLTRVSCPSDPCDPVETLGTVAAGTLRVVAVAITALAERYVLAVGREDGTVDVWLVDDAPTVATATTFADIPGASGGRFSSPMPFGVAENIGSLRITATPTPTGATVVLAVLSESASALRRIWTASFTTCAL